MKRLLAMLLILFSASAALVCVDESEWPCDGPAAEFAFGAASYAGVVHGDYVSFDITYSLDVFGSGWADVPLFGSELLVEDARLDGSPVSLSVIDEFLVCSEVKCTYPVVGKRYHLITDAAGSHTLKVKARAKLLKGASIDEFSFFIPSAQQTKLSLEIPGSVAVNVHNEFGKSVEQRDGKTFVTATIQSMENLLSVSWGAGEAVPSEVKEPIVFADVSQLVTVGESSVKGSITLSYSILQAGVNQLRITLPDTVEVLDVSSWRMSEWKEDVSAGVKTIIVFFGSEVVGSEQVVVSWERAVSGESFATDVPEVTAVGVRRENGFIAIASKDSVEVSEQSAEGLIRIDATELPESVYYSADAPVLFAYKYLNHPYSAVFTAVKHEEVPVLTVAADKASIITLVTPEGKMLTKAQYSVRNNKKQFLQVILPEGSELWSAVVDGEPVKPAKSGEAYLIPLVASQKSGSTLRAFAVEFVYVRDAPAMQFIGLHEFVLPSVDVAVSELSFGLYAPASFEYPAFWGLDREYDSYVPEIYSEPSYGYGYAPQAAPASMDELLSARVEEVSEFAGAVEEARVKGVLPVQVSVPEKGDAFVFSKALVTPEQRLTVGGWYLGGTVAAVLLWAVFVGVAFFVWRFFRAFGKGKKEWKMLGKAGALTVAAWLLVSYTLVFAVFAWFIAGFAGVAFVVYSHFTRKRK
ncbi:MAG: hypothetical protein JW834_00840 [Candidatus Diapherotrites archaeon]|nr:hypothetical protein [Candidatus Diapherotrites archaeon]